MTHILVPREPNAILLRPFTNCPQDELPLAWVAMVRAAEVQNKRAGNSTAKTWQTLRDYAEGRIDHTNAGSCPDSIEGPTVRDPNCTVCQALDAIAGAAPAAVAPQGEYPPLPPALVYANRESLNGMQNMDFAEVEPLPSEHRSAGLYDADQLRAYFDLGRQQPAAVAGLALSLVERQAVDALCAVALAARHIADDSPYDGNGTVPVEHSDMQALIDALDKLDSLPDDQPGYLMDPAAKAAWALRRLLDAPPALEAPAAPGAIVKAIREYLGAHEVSGRMDGRAVDDMALELARIALDFKHLVNAQAEPDAPAYLVGDMASLVKQLVQALRKAAPNHALPAQALDYLRRQGLLGSPLRVGSAAPAVDALICHALRIAGEECDHLSTRQSVTIDRNDKERLRSIVKTIAEAQAAAQAKEGGA